MTLKSGQLLDDLLQRNASDHCDDQFLNFGGRWFTHSEGHNRSSRLAAGLADIGVKPGDRVASILPNCIESADLLFACAKLGAIHVPVNIFLKGEFLRYQLVDCDPAVVVGDRSGIELATGYQSELPSLQTVLLTGGIDDASDPTAPGLADGHLADLMETDIDLPNATVNPSTILSLLYTSGTTGMPKGCIITHGYAMSMARFSAVTGDIRPGDVIFTAFPLYHAAAFVHLLQAVFHPAAISLDPSFSASDFLRRARELRATIYGGVGATAAAILAQPPSPRDKDHQMERMLLFPCSAEMQEVLEERFGVQVSAERYGQTECNPATASNFNGVRKRSSLGRALPYVDVQVVDEFDRPVPAGDIGEAVFRPLEPYALFGGYWRKGNETAEAWRNLWHHTGDLCRMDEDGYIYFVDRKKDAVRRRGENVSSIELERAIVAHDLIEAVAVHAVASSLTEEDIKACIVVVPGAELIPEELFEFFKSTLPYYAIPRYVEILPELPTNPMGRTLKHKLRDAGNGPATWDFEELGLVVRREDRR